MASCTSLDKFLFPDDLAMIWERVARRLIIACKRSTVYFWGCAYTYVTHCISAPPPVPAKSLKPDPKEETKSPALAENSPKKEEAKPAGTPEASPAPQKENVSHEDGSDPSKPAAAVSENKMARMMASHENSREDPNAKKEEPKSAPSKAPETAAAPPKDNVSQEDGADPAKASESTENKMARMMASNESSRDDPNAKKEEPKPASAPQQKAEDAKEDVAANKVARMMASHESSREDPNTGKTLPPSKEDPKAPPSKEEPKEPLKVSPTSPEAKLDPMISPVSLLFIFIVFEPFAP
uniref:Uncharacterized protein n=1 Tax=Caenorhabditis japonica TaxID=281687 RepID=A0A8R1HNC6_CAEJA